MQVAGFNRFFFNESHTRANSQGTAAHSETSAKAGGKSHIHQHESHSRANFRGRFSATADGGSRSREAVDTVRLSRHAQRQLAKFQAHAAKFDSNNAKQVSKPEGTNVAKPEVTNVAKPAEKSVVTPSQLVAKPEQAAKPVATPVETEAKPEQAAKPESNSGKSTGKPEQAAKPESNSGKSTAKPEQAAKSEQKAKPEQAAKAKPEQASKPEQAAKPKKPAPAAHRDPKPVIAKKVFGTGPERTQAAGQVRGKVSAAATIVAKALPQVAGQGNAEKGLFKKTAIVETVTKLTGQARVAEAQAKKAADKAEGATPNQAAVQKRPPVRDVTSFESLMGMATNQDKTTLASAANKPQSAEQVSRSVVEQSAVVEIEQAQVRALKSYQQVVNLVTDQIDAVAKNEDPQPVPGVDFGA